MRIEPEDQVAAVACFNGGYGAGATQIGLPDVPPRRIPTPDDDGAAQRSAEDNGDQNGSDSDSDSDSS